jgi:hypothetical protein
MNRNGEFAKKEWQWPTGNYNLGICLYQTIAWNLRHSKQFPLLRSNRLPPTHKLFYFRNRLTAVSHNRSIVSGGNKFEATNLSASTAQATYEGGIPLTPLSLANFCLMTNISKKKKGHFDTIPQQHLLTFWILHSLKMPVLRKGRVQFSAGWSEVCYILSSAPHLQALRVNFGWHLLSKQMHHWADT